MYSFTNAFMSAADAVFEPRTYENKGYQDTKIDSRELYLRQVRRSEIDTAGPYDPETQMPPDRLVAIMTKYSREPLLEDLEKQDADKFGNEIEGFDLNRKVYIGWSFRYTYILYHYKKRPLFVQKLLECGADPFIKIHENVILGYLKKYGLTEKSVLLVLKNQGHKCD